MISPRTLGTVLLGAAVTLPASTVLAQVERDTREGCELYVTSADRETDDEYRFFGRVGNAGPGAAQNVRIEVALLDDRDRPLLDGSSSTAPTHLGPGEEGSWEVRFSASSWNRAIASASHAATRVTISSPACQSRDEGAPDAHGNRRADYMAIAMEALEMRTKLLYEQAREARRRGALRTVGAGVRKQRSLTRSLDLKRAEITAIDTYLAEELPALMREAEAPTEWIDALPSPASP